MNNRCLQESKERRETESAGYSIVLKSNAATAVLSFDLCQENKKKTDNELIFLP